MKDKDENNISDRRLAARVLNGDSAAFKTVINDTEGLVAQIVFKLVDNVEDRKDLVQEIYLKVYRGLAGFKFDSKLSTWIARIAFNTCINYRKRMGTARGVMLSKFEMDKNVASEIAIKANADYGNEIENAIFSQQQSEIIWSEIEQLSPIYKTLVVLYHQEEKTYEEIASIVSLPEGTVKSYLFRARKILKGALLKRFREDEL